MSTRRPFLALAIAEVLSISGTRLSAIGIPWLVLTTTGSPVLTGLVAMVEMLPYVIAKALGGPLIDRVGPRRVAVVADTASALVVVVVPLLHVLGALSIAVLLPIVFVMGVLRGPSDAAKQSMVPDIAQLAEVPLERVTGVVSTIERLATTAGTAGAGVLIAMIGPSEALLVNGATFVLAALVVGFGLPALRQDGKPTETAPTSYRQELAEGWTFLRQDAVLVSIVIMVAITNLFDQAYFAIMLPVWTQQSGHGADMLGALVAVFFAGAMVGAAIAASMGERLPRLLVYSLAFLLAGFPRFAVFVLDVPVSAIVATLAVSGLAAGFINPILSAVTFERIPKVLLGRVTSIYGALCWALIPFGGLLGGALISVIGLSPAILAVGIAYLGVTFFPLARKSFRGFERPSSNPA